MPSRTISCAGDVVDPPAFEQHVATRGVISPEIVRSVVDLPAPFEPIKVTISPSLTSIDMPLSA